MLSSTKLACLLFAALCALSGRAHAWQDLAEDYVRKQVELVSAKDTAAAARQQATWSLLGTGRAAVYPLIAVAGKNPALAWTAVHLLDALRTDAEVVRAFAEFLERPPAGLQSTGEVAGFLGSRLEDMLGVKLKTAEERRRWLQENASYLSYDPARFRFFIDEVAQKAKRPHIVTPQRATGHESMDLAYSRLILALHAGGEKFIQPMLGPEVKLVRKQRRSETTPELDIDAFADPPSNHRAFNVEQRGEQWLLRSGGAYFFFDGKTQKCVKAGLKPIE